ncbi:hypothetical protein KASHIRA_01520 [Serratia phage vB_SmaM-Kashira]|nr:hypothetical protein KASHIRA_01520 [Serratia phage vB_SmaM-Kashira]
MLKDPKDLNYLYSLGKRKGAQYFEVCNIVGDWLISVDDGKKVCKSDQLTRRRMFREAEFIVKPQVEGQPYKQGARISKEDSDGHPAWFYIVEVGEESPDGDVKLLVAY